MTRAEMVAELEKAGYERDENRFIKIIGDFDYRVVFWGESFAVSRMHRQTDKLEMLHDEKFADTAIEDFRKWIGGE